MPPKKKQFPDFNSIIEAVETWDKKPESYNMTDFPDDNGISQSVKDTDIVQLSYKNIEMYIMNAYNTQQSLLLYGHPGLGKSSIVQTTSKKIAARLGRELVFIDWQKASTEVKKGVMENPEKYFVFIDIRTAQLEPADLVGIPDIRSREAWLEMKAQKWVYLMSSPKSAGILFLDEINQGSPQVLKALYQVVLDRGVGNLSFTDGWGICAAGNLGAQFGNELLPPALTNRFMAGELIADPESWLKYAYANNIDDSIIAFIESRPEENFYRPPKDASSDPFPSPRQFFALSKQIAYWKKEYVEAMRTKTPMPQSIYKTISDTAAKLCGVNWAQRYITFMRYQKQFDWATIVKDPREAIGSKGGAKIDIDKQHAVVLVCRDALLKYLGEDSKLNEAEQLAFAKEFCKVFLCFNDEFRLILVNRINHKDRATTIKLASFWYNHEDEEPFKSALPVLDSVIKQSKGEV